METKVVKRKFKDQKDTGTAPDEDTQPTLLLMKTSGPAPSPGGMDAASAQGG